MTRSHPTVTRHLVAALLAAAGTITIAMTATPAALADPDPAAPVDDSPIMPAAAPPVADPVPAEAPADGAATPSATACRAFSTALNFAATNYEDFAYDSAGNGNSVDYADPHVHASNVTGRTALRQAAGTAMEAASTPGLQPDISGPMRSWSLRATKLLLVMGLHGGGDRLNNTANDMNTDARNVQMACAQAGTAV